MPHKLSSIINSSKLKLEKVIRDRILNKNKFKKLKIIQDYN